MQLGIDIGGTTINIGLVNDGAVLQSVSFPSFEKDATLPQTLDHLRECIDKVITPEVDFIGIGVPSVVDSVRGIVYDTANIASWKEVHIKEELEKTYGLSVSVNNDANCFAIGAASACGCDKDGIVVGVTLGTGVGMGVVYNGLLISGANSGVGELSCLPYKEKTYEDYCSKMFFLGKGSTPKDNYDRAMDGDVRSLDLFKEFGHHLAALIKMVLCAYDPNVIIIGGGVSKSSDLFDSAMREELGRIFPFPRSLDALRIIYTSKPDVPIAGASLLNVAQVI